MAVRDISCPQRVSQGVARVALGLNFSNMGDQPLPTDIWQNSYSNPQNINVNWSSGANTFDIPDTPNIRGMSIIPPRDNSVTIKLGWDGAGTGAFINPNGKFETTFDPDDVPTTLYITTGAAIANVQIITW